MSVIGLAMISHEDDILAETLAHNAAFLDAFYVLDGTTPNDYSRSVCEAYVHCLGYTHDSLIPWGAQPRDGWRQWLLQQAYADWGYDNWFCLLHGDEWWEHDPREVADEHPQADAIVFRLPVYFPRIWVVDKHPLEQLKWSLGPGWPEVRMFRGGENVAYVPAQHFNVTPSGVSKIATSDARIRHYAYRSPEVQRARAERHTETGFDPDNYQHVLAGHLLWDDAFIASWQRKPHWRELRKDE